MGWILGTASGTQGLPSYSNDETRMTFDLLWFGQICTTVAVAILEECYMAFANMQWVFLSDGLIVTHGLLASWNFHGIVFTGSARNITKKCHGLKWRTEPWKKNPRPFTEIFMVHCHSTGGCPLTFKEISVFAVLSITLLIPQKRMLRSYNVCKKA